MTGVKKTTIIIISIVLVLCIAGAGIILAQYLNKRETVTYSLDWNAKYETFAEAYSAADCAVLGTVSATNTYEYSGLVFTEASLDTAEVIKGNPEGDIKVLFTGGVLNNTEYKVKEIVIPTVGDTFLFLLSEKDNMGHRSPVGGYQGMFKLKDTGAEALNAENSDIAAFNPENQLEQEVISGGNNLYERVEGQVGQ